MTRISSFLIVSIIKTVLKMRKWSIVTIQIKPLQCQIKPLPNFSFILANLSSCLCTFLILFLLGVEGLFFNVFFYLISRMGHLRNNHAQGSKYPNSHCFVSIAKTEKFRKKKNRIDLYKGGGSCRSFRYKIAA